MSNGTTDVVLSVLCLAGADIADSRWEKELMVWLAEHDQSIRGLGCVEFDLDELGWSKEAFPQQQHFLYRLIDRAMDHTGWDKLGYTPNEKIVADLLKKVRRIIGQYSPEYIDEQAKEWHSEPLLNFLRCQQHGIYLHAEGCLICNDE